MCELGQRLLLLVRRYVSGYEQNPIQLAALESGPRQCQMPTMDRIERATKKPNVHECD